MANNNVETRTKKIGNSLPPLQVSILRVYNMQQRKEKTLLPRYSQVALPARPVMVEFVTPSPLASPTIPVVVSLPGSTGRRVSVFDWEKGGGCFGGKVF